MRALAFACCPRRSTRMVILLTFDTARCSLLDPCNRLWPYLLVDSWTAVPGSETVESRTRGWLLASYRAAERSLYAYGVDCKPLNMHADYTAGILLCNAISRDQKITRYRELWHLARHYSRVGLGPSS